MTTERKVGLSLTGKQLDYFQEQQLRQLHELQKAALQTFTQPQDNVFR